MVIYSVNRFSLPLLGSYYRILLTVDFDSQLGSCYWYIQGNERFIQVMWWQNDIYGQRNIPTLLYRLVVERCQSQTFNWASTSVESSLAAIEYYHQTPVPRIYLLSIWWVSGRVMVWNAENIFVWEIIMYQSGTSHYDTLRSRYLAVIFLRITHERHFMARP